MPSIDPRRLVVSEVNERATDAEPDEAMIRDVAANGVEDPLLIRPIDNGDRDGDEYEVIAGQLRLKAALETDQETVPVEIRELDDAEAYRETIRENYRSDLGKDVAPLDRAMALREWWGSGEGDDDTERPPTTAVAEAFGVSPATASRWVEPLRDEWTDFHGENEAQLNAVGGSTLQEIRKAASDPNERTELVEQAAARKISRASIVERKERAKAKHGKKNATPFDRAEKFHCWYDPFIDMPEDEVRFVAEAEMDPHLFERHPKHREIYKDTSIDSTIIESVERFGVIEAILVTPELEVISGWRRVLAARAAGREWIQAVVCDFRDEGRENMAMFLCNQYEARNEFPLYELRDMVLICDRWGLCDFDTNTGSIPAE